MILRVPKIYLINKQQLVRTLFLVGMLVIYLGSLFPWFFWPLGGFYLAIGAAMFVSAMVIDRHEQYGFFNRQDFLIPMLLYILLSFYIIVVNAESPKNYIINLFHIVIYYTLFRVSTTQLPSVSDFISKAMGWLLLVSMAFFLLYVLGFPLPSVNAQFRDGFYTFSNYFFFLLDDRSLSWIIPRFQGVFLEPGHLGTATSFLLFTQSGKWRRWYNIVLIVATLITFSLSAYVLLTAIIIMNLWVQRKNFIGKLLAVAALFGIIIAGSFVYRDGDNMLHDLILLRLEVDDGELAGNNRVTEDFQSEFDSFLESDDILFGREMDYDISGNSGYQVFIYDNGFVGLILLWTFYLLSMWAAPDRRAWAAVMFIALLAFLARGYLMWYNYYIPFFCVAFSNYLPPPLKSSEPSTAAT